MRRLALFPIILLLAACGAGAPSPATDASLDAGSPAASLDALPSESVDMAAVVSPECRAAFDTAAAAIAGNSSPIDTPSAFTDAIGTCTMDEWRTELDRLGGDSFVDQADAILQTVCAQPEVANVGLCMQVQ